jgi:signal transduction histidine kinase
MALKNLPIRRKLMTVILLTSSAAVLLTSGAFVTYEVLTSRKAMAESLVTRADILAANSTASLAFQDVEDANGVLAALKTDSRTVAACLYDADGEIFAHYPAGLNVSECPPRPEQPGHRFEPPHLLVFRPVVHDGRPLGTVYIKTDLSLLTERYRVYAWLAAAIIFGSILLAYLLSRTLQRQISQPILDLTETARAISNQRDYSVRAVKASEDELGLLTDAFNEMLTEIHKLNATLEQRVRERTAELESVNKELESFSYSVSHDLRAPLRHISGFTDLLRNKLGAQLEPSAKHQLEIISTAATNMGKLIDDLLVFSRIGRAALRHDKLDMNAVVKEVLDEMASDLTDRRINWDVGELPVVRGDRTLLKQVWVNLISNAVKYSRDRNPAEIKIAAKKSAGEWEFSIKDNGAGFDMRYADKLFGVFQRLHLAEEFEGTGIGLANVQRIVLRHGGSVRAEGKVNEGATFYFTLPHVEEIKS